MGAGEDEATIVSVPPYHVAAMAALASSIYAGRRIVQLVKDKVSISKILTKKAFENAIRANAAIGGSTNAVIHHGAAAGSRTCHHWASGESSSRLWSMMAAGSRPVPYQQAIATNAAPLIP